MKRATPLPARPYRMPPGKPRVYVPSRTQHARAETWDAAIAILMDAQLPDDVRIPLVNEFWLRRVQATEVP